MRRGGVYQLLLQSKLLITAVTGLCFGKSEECVLLPFAFICRRTLRTVEAIATRLEAIASSMLEFFSRTSETAFHCINLRSGTGDRDPNRRGVGTTERLGSCSAGREPEATSRCSQSGSEPAGSSPARSGDDEAAEGHLSKCLARFFHARVAVWPVWRGLIVSVKDKKNDAHGMEDGPPLTRPRMSLTIIYIHRLYGTADCRPVRPTPLAPPPLAVSHSAVPMESTGIGFASGPGPSIAGSFRPDPKTPPWFSGRRTETMEQLFRCRARTKP